MFITIKDRDRNEGNTILNIDNVIEIYEIADMKGKKFIRFRCIDDSHIDADLTYEYISQVISNHKVY